MPMTRVRSRIDVGPALRVLGFLLLLLLLSARKSCSSCCVGASRVGSGSTEAQNVPAMHRSGSLVGV